MTKKKITVLVNGKIDNSSYIKFLQQNFEVDVLHSNKLRGGEKIDLILFIGGEDVYPGYYNQSTGSKTKYNENRDSYEKNYLFDSYPTIPKIGICRGAQALTVFTGGSLLQHVEGHSNNQLQEIEVNEPYDRSDYFITSTHHQMMYPFNMNPSDYQIIGHSKYHLSSTYLNGKDNEVELPVNFVEPEIVYYSKTKSLCIQGHPEMKECPENTQQMIFNLMNYFLKL
jgi:gamma-glutamyl-gamma-aminobutyrate hydrolase PuuD